MIEKPLRYGQGFSVVDKRILRHHRNNTDRTFTAAQIRCVLASENDTMRAVTLLGVNNALGPHDVVSLCWTHIRGSELIFPRPKTGVERRSILWPETLEALEKLPRADGIGIVLWHRRLRKEVAYGARTIGARVTDALKRAGIDGSHYGLRHTFTTIASQTADDGAVRCIMGHEDPTMLAVYRQSFPTERLELVADHVHAWLFHSGKAPK